VKCGRSHIRRSRCVNDPQLMCVPCLEKGSLPLYH